MTNIMNHYQTLE